MTTATATQPVQNLPDSAFADRGQRRYPVHTKTATCESAAQAVADKADVSVIGRIKEAAHIHGVTVEVSQVLHSTQKEAVAEDQYWGIPDRKQYPLNHEKDIRDAITYLGKHAAQMPYDDRRVFASNLIDAVERTGGDFARAPGGGDLKHALEITAGRGFCTKKEAMEVIREREVMTRGGDRDDLRQLRESVAAMPRMEPAFLVKLAGVLDDVDNAYQLKLNVPEETLFSMTQSWLVKAASELIELKDGSIFRRSDLGRLQSDAVRNWMGCELADEVCELGITSPSKMAAQLEIMPRSDVPNFIRCAQSCGVEPLRA